MDEIINEQENPGYATPFNVDLFGSKPKNFYAEYTRRVLALPESVRNIMMDSSTAEFVGENLSSTYNLTAEQGTEITRIIRDILLGDAPLNSMPSLISSKLDTDQETSSQIANKIVNELFSPAIEDIKKLQADRPPERPDLKIDPSINKNNIVDLRNRNS